MDNNYYVYEHIRNDNNTVFYVGKGRGWRAYTKSRNPHHDRIAKKYGFTVRIVKDNLTEEEAFNLEKEVIANYIFNLGYGIDIEGLRKPDSMYNLTNLTLGGDGNYGAVHTQEWCEQHSKDMMGEKNPMFGVNVWDSFTEEKAREIREKMSKNNLGEKNKMFGVSPKDRMSPEKYQEWYQKISSRMSSQIGEKNPNWHNDTLKNKLKENPELKQQYYSRPGKQNGRCVAVDLYDKNDIFIQHFDYLSQCAQFIKDALKLESKVNTMAETMGRCIKNGKRYRGYKIVKN